MDYSRRRIKFLVTYMYVTLATAFLGDNNKWGYMTRIWLSACLDLGFDGSNSTHAPCMRTSRPRWQLGSGGSSPRPCRSWARPSRWQGAGWWRAPLLSPAASRPPPYPRGPKASCSCRTCTAPSGQRQRWTQGRLGAACRDHNFFYQSVLSSKMHRYSLTTKWIF